MANRGRRYNGVKVKVAKSFEAADGTVFDTPEAAEAHSQKNAFKSLYKMTEATVDDILSGKDDARANLILSLAGRIRRYRDENPGRYPKRERKPKEGAANGNGHDSRQIDAFEGDEAAA